MDIEKPYKGKAEITNKGDSLEIVIPSKKNIFSILFLCVWLVAWFFGETTVASSLIQGKAEPFLLVWLIGWTIGGAFVFLIIIWNIAGKEIITLSPQILGIEKKVMNIGRAKEYSLSDIKNFRVYNIVENSIFLRQRSIGFWFDYGEKTIRFASGTDESEANHILDLFKQNGIEKFGACPIKEIKRYKGGTLIEKFFYIIFLCLGILIFIGLVGVLFANKKDATGFDILIVIFFCWAYFHITHSIIGRPCPSCKRWRAGKKQMKEGSQIFLKCKYCGHEWIIEKVDPQVGGG